SIEDRPEERVVCAGTTCLHRLFNRMRRYSYDEIVSQKSPSRIDGDGIGRQMNSMRSAGKRRVRSIIHQNLCAGSFSRLQDGFNERAEPICRHVLFADLNEIYPCTCSASAERRERVGGFVFAIRFENLSVGYQAE